MRSGEVGGFGDFRSGGGMILNCGKRMRFCALNVIFVGVKVRDSLEFELMQYCVINLEF